MRLQNVADQVLAHERRNDALRRLFLEKKVDQKALRDIELHFWAWSSADAQALADSLRTLKFEITAQRPAGIQSDPERWTIDALVRQSIDLTMRREFVSDLIDIAYAHRAEFDGWGTSI